MLGVKFWLNSLLNSILHGDLACDQALRTSGQRVANVVRVRHPKKLRAFTPNRVNGERKLPIFSPDVRGRVRWGGGGGFSVWRPQSASARRLLQKYPNCKYVERTPNCCFLLDSLPRRRSFGSSRTPPQLIRWGGDHVTSQKNVCVGGYLAGNTSRKFASPEEHIGRVQFVQFFQSTQHVHDMYNALLLPLSNMLQSIDGTDSLSGISSLKTRPCFRCL